MSFWNNLVESISRCNPLLCRPGHVVDLKTDEDRKEVLPIELQRGPRSLKMLVTVQVINSSPILSHGIGLIDMNNPGRSRRSGSEWCNFSRGLRRKPSVGASLLLMTRENVRRWW